MSSTKYASQDSYNERMKKAGFVKIGVWVPADDRDSLLDKAYEMRVHHARKKGFELDEV